MIICPMLSGQEVSVEKVPGAADNNSLTYYTGSSFCSPDNKALRLFPSKGKQVAVGFAHDSDHTALFAIALNAPLKDTLRVDLLEKCSFITIHDPGGNVCVLEKGELLITKNTAGTIKMAADYQYHLPGKKKL
jgi:hypothetical protein